MKKNLLLFSFALSVFTFALLGFGMVWANAETEGIYTYRVEDDHALITGITQKSSERIVLPDTLGGYPVTGIRGHRMLEGEYVVEELVIPAGITEISDHPFNMAHLKRFTVNENNPAFLSDDGVLLDKAQTKVLKCPTYYPEKVYTVPATVTEIDWGAFSNARTLETVILPEGVTTLGNQAFAFTETIKNIKIPDTVTLIDQNCFAYNYAIERIVVPESVTTLRSSAFTDCISLQSAVILGPVTTLEPYVFDNTDLKTVVLPATLTEIKNDVFVRTPGLERVLFAGTREQWDAVTVGSNNGSLPEAEVFCDFPAFAYKNIDVAEENGMVTIGGSGALPGAETATYHFWDEYAETAETLYITGEIAGIGANSFVDFPALSNVILRADGVSLAAGAFRGCENLENIILLGDAAFTGDPFVDCGEDMDLFFTAGALRGEDALPASVNPIAVSYADGVLRYSGAVVQDSYDFFDVLSVFCDRYGGIDELRVSDFAFTDISVYAYNAAEGTRSRIAGTLTDCTIYPQITADGETRRISFNTLCAGIADGSVTGFYLVIDDEAHEEIQDTQISILERISAGIQRVLRAIVTLLNKLFRLLKSFGG